MEQRLVGICRSRLADLQRVKGQKKAPKNRFSKAALLKKYELQEESYMKSTLLTCSSETGDIELGMVDAPVWLEEYRECCAILKQVELLQTEIVREKKKKLHSVDEKKHDRIIQSFLDDATLKLNQCEKKLKGMQRVNHAEMLRDGKRSFTNMLIALATSIREQARRLRLHQYEELNRERQLSNYTKSVFDIRLPAQQQSWISQEGLEVLQGNLDRERNQQIRKIVKSIYSLNSIYKQLQNLVIQQGSLLDRIDENIDTTAQHVSQAVVHLQEANKKQQSKCFSRVRLIIILLIAACMAILLVKLT